MTAQHTGLHLGLPALAAVLAVVFCGVGLSGVRAEGPALPSASSKVAAELNVPLVAHRAIYNLTLLKSTGAKSPTSARGRLFYEFTGSPRDGYSQMFRQVTEVQPAEGATRLSDMRSATFEDGKDFSFYVKTTSDENAPDVVGGRAVKKRNHVLDIQLSKPTPETIDVDNEVLFPTEHLKRIIAAAKAGQHILDVKVFDGSDDGKKVYDTTTIIGRPITTPAADVAAAHVASMATMQRWPVTIGYFGDDKKDEGPSYTLAFELYENGVSRALRFDYGDFTLAGQMTNLDLLPPKKLRE